MDSKAEDVPERTEGTYQSLPPVTDHERDIASRCASDFEKGNFESCLAGISNLYSVRTLDPKVMHNKGVAEYYISGLRKTDEFRKCMNSVCHLCQVSLDNIATLDDVDHCIVYYNHAVILHHLKQYQTALAVMDKLFQYIEPLEENIARKIAFLHVELYLCTQQPEKAYAMLGFIEKNILSNGKSQQQTPDKDREQGHRDSEMSGDVWRPKISQYKARCYLMLKSMKACKREIKNMMNSVGLGPQLVYLKSNFEYLRGNYRKAIKVLNSAPSQTKGPQETGECIPAMYYNNMACIHFHMRKHNLGAFYLRKALQENENASKDVSRTDLSKSLSGLPVFTLGISRHHELLYNMGIQLLHCGKALAAFECLIIAIQVYHTNPRLWLRLAECCIQANKENNDEDRKLSHRLEVVQGSVGSGVHRKLIIGPGITSNYKLSNESAAIPTTSLEFAAMCLRNALTLLPDERIPPVPSEDAEPGKPAHDSPLPAPPANPMKANEVANLRCSVLCQTSYVALCLNDFLVAALNADRLLKQPKLSGAHRYLGNMYLGEALVSLDRIADAVQHFNPDAITDVSVTPPDYKQDQERDRNGEAQESENRGALFNWIPRDVMKAKAIMQYNLATAHAIRGEHEKAIMNLAKSTQVIGTPFPSHIYFLRLYLDLMEGRRKLAQGVIKEHFGHMTPNRA
ncbi:CCR4-NOT transcription complex subunit 10-like [Lineus longissimus]|uniref:CCR4-NOT transcription complex subunit 10-like n=1 Tax=Lineus longissimus TaxID=88925 RepID=UPI002B4E6F86